MGAKYLLIQDLSQQGSMTLPYQEFALRLLRFLFEFALAQ